MTDNAELMRLRGEFVTLEKELKSLHSQVSGEAELISNWISKFRFYSSHNYETGRYPEIEEYETMMDRIKRMHEAHQKAEEVRKKLKHLKPMTGL